MNKVVSIPYEELSLKQKLRLFWHDFTQCDWWHDDFEREMEEAGFISFERATKRDVEETSFAAELGIIAGQPIWKWTKKGRAVLDSSPLRPAETCADCGKVEPCDDACPNSLQDRRSE